MNEITEQPWAGFMERLAKELIENGAEQAMCITRNKEADRITSNFFNCDFEKRWILLGHLMADYIIEIIEVNAELVRQILDGEVDENDDD